MIPASTVFLSSPDGLFKVLLWFFEQLLVHYTQSLSLTRSILVFFSILVTNLVVSI